MVVKRSSGYSYRLEGGKLEGKSGKVKRAAAAYGSGRRPLQSSHAQTIAVTEPKAPATRPMARGPTYCDAMPAADMDTIMTLQRMDSMVLNTRPRTIGLVAGAFGSLTAIAWAWMDWSGRLPEP